MTGTLYAYAIGTAWNMPLGSLTNIQNIKPSGDVRAFYPPESLGSYRPGVFRIRGDGSVYIAGQSSLEWRWQSITIPQVRYLQTTYCGSLYSGTVTINSTTDNAKTFARFNARMILPQLPDTGRNFTRYTNYTVRFVRLTAL